MGDHDSAIVAALHEYRRCSEAQARGVVGAYLAERERQGWVLARGVAVSDENLRVIVLRLEDQARRALVRAETATAVVAREWVEVADRAIAARARALASIEPPAGEQDARERARLADLDVTLAAQALGFVLPMELQRHAREWTLRVLRAAVHEPGADG